MSDESIEPYEQGLHEFAARYEAVDLRVLHERLVGYLPARIGLALDIGAGTGRDAAWLAGMGWQVWASEPAEGFRALGQRLHGSTSIHWLDDRLPTLERVRRLGLSFDLVWLSAVWMHVGSEDRRQAFRRLSTLLRPGGRLVLSLRMGPVDPTRGMHPVTVAEVERLALEHGLSVRAVIEQSDALGRPDIQWKVVILEVPDDDSESLPIVRSIILQDVKAATYKLALLRAVVRAADVAAPLPHFNNDTVEIPLGLLALFWIRMFKPLVEQKVPQTPNDSQGRGLGFVKEGFRAVRSISPFELRPGASFQGNEARALALALRDAAYTIARMPARFTTFADGGPIFPTDYRGSIAFRDKLVLEAPTMWALGTTRLQAHLWLALRRLAAWIEPMLVSEWVRIVQRYSERQGRQFDGDLVRSCLRWIDPDRDTSLVRRLAAQMSDRGQAIYCVWTGKRIRDLKSLDIDHCFPWAAWPCDDLWNLLPSSRMTNQIKRDRLISRELLYSARDRIEDWWQRAYRKDLGDPLSRRFEVEALTTLAIADDPLGAQVRASEDPDNIELDRVIEAMDLQRLRLRSDQQIPEWAGVAS